MLIGLCGASRSGKTTLMKDVASRMGIAYHATSTSKVHEEAGVDLTKPMTLRDRLSHQLLIFDRHIAETESIKVPTILDRTPLDMLAYMACEIGMASREELREDGIETAVRYMEMCRQHTIGNYSAIFAVRSLPTYENAAFKPDNNPAYHQHFQMVVEGALTSLGDDLAMYAVIQTSDHDLRVRIISAQLAAMFARGTLAQGSMSLQ